MTDKIQLIVGLGNPGQQYHNTRHNAGEDFVRELARTYGCTLQEDKKYFGLVGSAVIDARPVRLLIPTTFMNRSGQAVGSLANFFKIAPESILVAHDELDLPPGTAKLKRGGGHGGHNGLKDIISHLGNNNNFCRLRIGIGHPGSARLVADYVLKKAAPDDFAAIEHSIMRAMKVMPDAIAGQWERAMLNLHSQ